MYVKKITIFQNAYEKNVRELGRGEKTIQPRGGARSSKVFTYER